MITLVGAGAIIKDSDDKVFLVKVKRRGMCRWEIPTGIRQRGDSIFLTLYRCIEQESLSKFTVRIGRAVCLGINSSKQYGRSYFAMFFECQPEYTDIKIANDIERVEDISDELRQKIVESDYIDWRSLKPDEIHPQHHKILLRWTQIPTGPLFSVISDADSEHEFYIKKGNTISQLIDVSPSENQNKDVDSEKMPGVTVSLNGPSINIVDWTKYIVKKIFKPKKKY